MHHFHLSFFELSIQYIQFQFNQIKMYLNSFISKFNRQKISCQLINNFQSIINQFMKNIFKTFHNTILFNPFHTFVNVQINSKYYHKPLPNQLQPSFALLKAQPKFNQKSMLLEHIVDLLKADPKLILTHQHKNILTSQLNQWKGKQGTNYKLATIAWVIRKLNMRTYDTLYYEIAQAINEDEWYVNFDEAVKAMQAFTFLKNGQLKDQIYEKIQRNVGITLWEVDMMYYKRICESLLLAERFQSPLWNKLQEHIVRNLGMQYETRTICDIFRAFAISKNGSEDLFILFQKVILSGHLYSPSFHFKGLKSQFDTSGEFFALLTKTYGLIRQNSTIELLPEFKDFIYHALKNTKTQYASLSSIVDVIQYLPYLQFQKEEQDQIIDEIVFIKQPSLVNHIHDITAFYSLILQRYGKIQQSIIVKMQKLLISEIKSKRITLTQTVNIIKYLAESQILHSQTQLIKYTNCYIQQNFKYLGPSQAQNVVQIIQTLPKIINSKKEILMLTQKNKLKTDFLQ